MELREVLDGHARELAFAHRLLAGSHRDAVMQGQKALWDTCQALVDLEDAARAGVK